MQEKDELTKKFKMVHTNEIGISTFDKHIIGTQSLVTCIAFILYNKEYKKAIVGHIGADALLSDFGLENIRLEILNIVLNNQLKGTFFDLLMIEGAEKSNYDMYFYQLDILRKISNDKVRKEHKQKYDLIEILEENIKMINAIKINKIIKSNFPCNAFQIIGDGYSHTTLSKQFAFDALTGEFVTDKVLFGVEYDMLSNEPII